MNDRELQLKPISKEMGFQAEDASNGKMVGQSKESRTGTS